MSIFRRYKRASETVVVTRSLPTAKDRFGATDILNFEGSEGEGFYNQREPVSADIAKVYWRITFILYAVIILFVLTSY